MADSMTIQNVLYDRWDQIKAEQGFISKAWNGIKEFTNLGKSESDCESMLQKYKNHEISITEAMEYIEDFDNKQDSAVNLITNIATGVASIALATTAAAGGPIGWGLALTKGAPIGAAVKAGLKTLDRATNDIDGDALDAKEIIRDTVSGAVTGTTSAVSSGIFKGVTEATKTKTVAQGLMTSVVNGAVCGVECGAASGAIDYLTNTALDEDKDFKFSEMAKNAGTSALVSGSVGAVFGGGIFGAESAMGHLGKSFVFAENATGADNEIVISTTKAIARDSSLSSSRKVAGNAAKKLVNI